MLKLVDVRRSMYWDATSTSLEEKRKVLVQYQNKLIHSTDDELAKLFVEFLLLNGSTSFYDSMKAITFPSCDYDLPVPCTKCRYNGNSGEEYRIRIPWNKEILRGVVQRVLKLCNGTAFWFWYMATFCCCSWEQLHNLEIPEFSSVDLGTLAKEKQIMKGTM